MDTRGIIATGIGIGMERAYRIRTYTIIDSATGSLVTIRGPSLWRERLRRMAGGAVARALKEGLA
jgi:hypothetical protein